MVELTWAFQDPDSERFSRVAQLEAETERLSGLLSSSRGAELANERRSEELRQDCDRALKRVYDLEASVKSIECLLHDRDGKIESLEGTIAGLLEEMKKASIDKEDAVQILKASLDEAEATTRSLQQTLAAKEDMEKQVDIELQAKHAEILTLQGRFQKARLELEEERTELGSEIDALRAAGQVRTILESCAEGAHGGTGNNWAVRRETQRSGFAAVRVTGRSNGPTREVTDSG
jgi:CAP-Gly domain-containing linker protein 1